MMTSNREDGSSKMKLNNVDMKAELGRALDDALHAFRCLWDEIGIGEAQCAERVAVVVFHMRSLLEEMVSEERALRDKLLRNIDSYKEQLVILSSELSLPRPEVSGCGKTAILQQEKELRQQVDTLVAEKTERLQKLERLRSTDQGLCDALSATPFYIPSGAVPTREQLHQLDAHVSTLTRQKEERQKRFFSDRSKIIEIYEDLGQEPNTTFEQDVAIEDPECFVLSSENMELLKALRERLIKQQHDRMTLDAELRQRLTILWQRLELPTEELDIFMNSHSRHKPQDIEALQSEIKKCEHLKAQQAQRFIESVRADLVQWWTKCYFSEKQRSAFDGFTSEDFNEDLLFAHEQELQRVQQYYDANKEMLQKVERRAELWARMLEFDAKERDPGRYTNRGGGLLKEEKERKRILRELPKVEEQLKETVEAWELANGRDFLCNGVKFTDFCRQQWEEYHKRKDEEKQERQKKSKESNAETIFGNKPTTTPCKRRLNGGAPTTPAPKVTPAKLRKLNDVSTPHTPLTITRIAHKSVFASPAAAALPSKGRVMSSSTTKLNEMAPRTPGPAVAITRTPLRTADVRTPRGTRLAADDAAALDAKLNAKQARSRAVLQERHNVDEFSQLTAPTALTYQEFKVGLTEQSKQNWRSSELPQKS